MILKWQWEHPLYYVSLVFMIFPFGGIFFLDTLCGHCHFLSYFYLLIFLLFTKRRAG